MKILFAAAELAPLVKTGGLGDVAAALPAALAELGHEVTLLLPAYPALLDGVPGKREVGTLSLPGVPAIRVLQGRAPMDECALFLLDCPGLYRRDGDPYQDAQRRDWPDNALRFGVLGRAAALLASGRLVDGWRADILHCNDWHTALAPVYLKLLPDEGVRSVLTVHNLAFQGLFPAGAMAALALPGTLYSIEGVEYYGQLSFMKGGLNFADWITTVSPTYAREIQTEALGCGLDGLLRRRRLSVSGILNGIDLHAWDPGRDPYVAQPYGPSSLEGKAVNKAWLQDHLNLEVDPDIPLFGAVQRLTHQKGSDILAAAAAEIAALPAQLAILGTGDPEYERQLAELAAAHPGRIAARIGYDEALAHQIEAGADAFLMPSRFEPCGMNQMYSQRYGTVPVVHRTGGLADSVVECNKASLQAGTASGFLFRDADRAGLLAAVKRAWRACLDPHVLRQLQRNGMARDFGWRPGAERYAEIYGRLATRARR